MKRRILFYGILLLATLPLTVLAQSKPKARTRSADKPVTVTLVRWPYT